jgi:hypothetical protein
MRCGCTNPCPACPGAVYEDMMEGVTIFAPLVITVPVAPGASVDLLTRVVTIPAGLPGLGTTIVAEWNACAGGDQNEMLVVWSIEVDGVVVQSRVITAWFSGECRGLPIGAGVQQLSPGTHVITLNVTAVVGSATSTLSVTGASMRTDLIRSDQLTVTGGP